MSSHLEGTGALVRLALRRDRVLIPVWAVALVASAWSSASATAGLYPTTASRVAAAEAINGTPALVALYGRVLDPASLGAVAMLKMGGFGAVLVSVLAIVLVVRHTRADEDEGRLDLVRSAVVGRRAPLTAAVVTAVAVVVVIGALAALSLMATGLPAAGSLAFGAGWAGAGTVFAGVAAVCAQVGATSRGANGLAGGVLATAYVLRASGDASGDGAAGALSWFSPIGWSQQLRPFASERWSVLVLFVVLTPVLVVAAYALSDRRDVGAGLLADRPGPARAAASLRSPLALAWKLESRPLLAWFLAFVALGGVIGGIAAGVRSLLDSPQAQDMITRLGGHASLTDAFLAAELGIAGLVTSVFVVQSTGRLHAEEAAGRAEPVLATATGRLAWAGAQLSVALVGSVLLLTGAGLSAGIVHAVDTKDTGQVGRVLAGALVQLPAVWVVGAIAVAAFGLLPQAAAAGWFALGLFLLLGEVGPVVGLDHRVIELSPFAHVPHLPGGSVGAASLLSLLAVAAALTAVGLVGWRRRDLA